MSNLDAQLAHIDSRIKERSAESKAKEFAALDPVTPVIDAGKFTQQVADLAKSLALKIEREEKTRLSHPFAATDIGVILRQLY